jgi:RNA polymerase sigma-70 factor (ECF subfamily)
MSLRTASDPRSSEPPYTPETCGKRSRKHCKTASETAATTGQYPDCSDEQLIALIRKGETSAFGELVARHFTACFGRAFLMLRNHSDAEDEVQNAFSKALESLHQFRCQGPFGAWLSRIVQNQCLMLIRERRRAAFVSVDASSDSKARLELVDQLADQEQQLGSQQVDNLVHNQIARIPPILRDVMLLYDVQGLPMPDVAARLGISVSATKSRLMRGRRELRSRLTEHRGRRESQSTSAKGMRQKAEYTYLN